jgi:hypothetical protein
MKKVWVGNKGFITSHDRHKYFCPTDHAREDDAIAECGDWCAWFNTADGYVWCKEHKIAKLVKAPKEV